MFDYFNGIFPFKVYDLLRCIAYFNKLDELNKALKKLTETFKITRIKNKLQTTLS